MRYDIEVIIRACPTRNDIDEGEYRTVQQATVLTFCENELHKARQAFQRIMMCFNIGRYLHLGSDQKGRWMIGKIGYGGIQQRITEDLG